MASGLIIVVDDNATFRKLYSDFLGAHGYTVITANSAVDAMQKLLNCTPKVLILDISMPEMDGIEACRKIRQIHGSELPIIFLTAFNDVEKLRECMLAGGDDFMIKSGKLDAILERVNFWSNETNRLAARERRKSVVKSIDSVMNSGGEADGRASGAENAPDNAAAL